MGFWPVVLNVLKNADVVLIIADARIPEETTNKEILRKIERLQGKRVFLVFNKADLLSSQKRESLAEKFHSSYLVSGVKKTGLKKLKKDLENMAEHWKEPSLRVGLVGYPNVGKSTILNILAPGAKAKISSVSGTTKKTQWIRSGRLRFMDSPGVIPRTDRQTKVGLVGAKDPQKIRQVERVALQIIEKVGLESLGNTYGVKANEVYELFLAIGKKRGYLIKGGEIDERRTAIMIVDDWQKGKLNVS